MVANVWPMSSTLVVDFGRHENAAALITGEVVQQIACPQLDHQHLRAVIASTAVPIERLVLTTPTAAGPSTVERAMLLRLATDAGYPDVELVTTAIAAAMDPLVRPDLPETALVLVCDLGVAWSASLVRLSGANAAQLSEEVASVNLTRSGLDTLTESALRWLVASCRAVVARAGYTLSEVSGLVLVGGGARLPMAAHILDSELGQRIFRPRDPEYAVIRGAARWADQRGIKASPATWRIEPLCWEITEAARLLRWLVPPGHAFEQGMRLAQIRTLDDRVYDLHAARDGIMVEHRLLPGAYVNSGEILALSRSAQLIAGDRPVKRLELKVSGDWMLAPDRQHIVEAADTGAYVRMRALDTGAVVHEVRPHDRPEHGRVFVHPSGRMALVSWDEGGRFSVRDIASGQLVSRFQAAARPLSVLVDESQWRLVSEVDRQVSVGRYRRDVAMMWDLDTGDVVEQMVGDDLHKRFTGYFDRSLRHGFSDEPRSPDGRLRAGCTQLDGHAAVWLHRSDTDEEVFRAELTTTRGVRSAFSADGHYLMSNWRSAEESCLDVWKI